MKLNFRRFFCCLSAGSRGDVGTSASGDGEDHISRLPNDVLSSIISLLPVTDGARTALLSSQWRGLWASTPLVLDDSDLLLSGNFISVRAVAATVSRLIDAHPGPFRSVALTCYLAECEQGTLTGWIQALATKGVHELVLNNIPWGELDVLPSALFLCRSLERLYVSSWRFPDTAAAGGVLLRGTAFPRLRELVLCNTIIKDADLEKMLAWCAVLKTLMFMGNGAPVQIHLSSRSLRCIVFWYSAADELTVVSAPLLERVILSNLALRCSRRDDHCMRIKLSRASGIRVVGYLNPSNHRLLVGNTLIKAGTKASPEVAVPSVKILGLEFRFGVAKESCMVPGILRSFPNTETLHLMSLRDNGSSTRTDGAGNFEYLKDFDSVECVRSSIKKVVIHGFRWENCEIELLKCIVERGKEIKKIYIFDAPDVSERDDKLGLLASLNLGGTVMILSGEDSILTHGIVSDLSRIDPFDCRS